MNKFEQALFDSSTPNMEVKEVTKSQQEIMINKTGTRFRFVIDEMRWRDTRSG